jgi:cob(I)alamin adenosyltransferase
MKLYTKKGDQGKTSLYDGEKVSKTFSLIHALGDIDELNSFIGMARAQVAGEMMGDGDDGAEDEGEVSEVFVEILDRVQRDLYRVGGDLAGLSAREGPVGERDVEYLERTIDSLPCDVGRFVPPGAHGELSARLHVCRSVCRRAERSVIGAVGDDEGERETTFPHILQYLNRLSDLFFAMAEC